jgi:hypothetical protein
MNKQNAYQRYQNQDQDNACMQEPVKTRNGLYIWEHWTYKYGNVTSIRYYAEDINGGNTMRLSKGDYLNLINK